MKIGQYLAKIWSRVVSPFQDSRCTSASPSLRILSHSYHAPLRDSRLWQQHYGENKSRFCWYGMQKKTATRRLARIRSQSLKCNQLTGRCRALPACFFNSSVTHFRKNIYPQNRREEIWSQISRRRCVERGHTQEWTVWAGMDGETELMWGGADVDDDVRWKVSDSATSVVAIRRRWCTVQRCETN